MNSVPLRSRGIFIASFRHFSSKGSLRSARFRPFKSTLIASSLAGAAALSPPIFSKSNMNDPYTGDKLVFDSNRSDDTSAAEAVTRLRYTCSLDSLHTSPLLSNAFLPLTPDTDTHDFVRMCFAQFRPFAYTRLMSLLVKPFLSSFMGHSDVNGWLGVGQMHMLSTKQCRDLLRLNEEGEEKKGEGKEAEAAEEEMPGLIDIEAKDASSSSSSLSSATEEKEKKEEKKIETKKRTAGRLLDIGAGDGRVTTQFAPCFDEVVTTEVASQMVKRLRAKGFTCHQTADIKTGVPHDGGYDVVSLFNVIDRCNFPRQLLMDVKPFLKSINSRVIVATPLPLNAWVEVGTKWVRPAERLTGRCCGGTWEDGVKELAREYFLPCGFKVLSVSRLPYLSQGDNYRPFYVLDDAVFVLSPLTDEEQVALQLQMTQVGPLPAERHA